jgi:hypothetical protein
MAAPRLALDREPAAPLDDLDEAVKPSIEDFSRLAGPVEEPPKDGPYEVRYRAVRTGRRKGPLVLVALTLAGEAFFIAWLLHPAHRPPVVGPTFAVAVHYFLISSIGVIEFLRMVNVVSLSVASLVARDPVVVRPDVTLRVAFLTTIVPSKEPIEMVRATLTAATQIKYGGCLDVWILDEGDDEGVKAMALALGIRHFSRKGVDRYNQPEGRFRAKTKHGNYNAWVDAHGDGYDVLLSVDPDHIPLPNYAERILGFFRDPDVAYVVGPQCYRNTGTFVTRGAESQQFPFHSVIQRAANRYGAAMLVGTNNAIRISALNAVGGLSDSITEDMATGLHLHSSRNAKTSRRWKSVYTPDVLAAGEGPSTWSDYFSQQMRWSRGTFEILLLTFWRRFFRLSPGRMWHYTMITAFYPSMAIGWILGATSAAAVLAFGVHGIIVSLPIWIALYADVTAFQLWLYFSNRRYNVSPYEGDNSTGLHGIGMSILAAPIYASQLVATALRRPARFVVTPKGASASQDGLRTFRRHLGWVALLVGATVGAVIRGYATTATVIWATINIVICVTPIVQWGRDTWRARRLDTADLQEPESINPVIELPRRAAPQLLMSASTPPRVDDRQAAPDSVARMAIPLDPTSPTPISPRTPRRPPQKRSAQTQRRPNKRRQHR